MPTRYAKGWRKQSLDAGVPGKGVRCSLALVPPFSLLVELLEGLGPSPSMACGLPELPWTFPAAGPNPVPSHQQLPKEQIFIVLGRKKKESPFRIRVWELLLRLAGARQRPKMTT